MVFAGGDATHSARAALARIRAVDCVAKSELGEGDQMVIL
jgi:hypothetical protein